MDNIANTGEIVRIGVGEYGERLALVYLDRPAMSPDTAGLTVTKMWIDAPAGSSVGTRLTLPADEEIVL
jgi:hypothetical protein